MKSRKYIGTVILDKAHEQDPCFATGEARTDVGKLRKLGPYALEPKPSYTFEGQVARLRAHQDTRKTIKIKTC